MATTISELKNLLELIDKKFFASDRGDSLILPYRCKGKIVHVFLALHAGGTFLQFRSRDFPSIESDNPAASAVFEELLAVALEKRFIKFGRDPIDGEIVGFGDVWLESDGQLGPVQLDQMIAAFVSGAAHAQERVLGVLMTGKSAHQRAIDGIFDSAITEHSKRASFDTPPDTDHLGLV